MRVTTGLYKGRIISTVKDLSVRPATDRVRQTIFNMLTNRVELGGTLVLDLFAGSGSLGIEALSRGAAHATFVESSPDAVQYLEKNIRVLGCEPATEILEMDALRFLDLKRGPYDIIFADPPYRFDRTAEIPERVFSGMMVKEHGYLLIEHAQNMRFQSSRLYLAGPEKRFGRTLVTFFRPHTAPETMDRKP
jgi:16S rRNA (guanine(966)-N(2))-methyltransferase RsmD